MVITSWYWYTVFVFTMTLLFNDGSLHSFTEERKTVSYYWIIEKCEDMRTLVHGKPSIRKTKYHKNISYMFYKISYINYTLIRYIIFFMIHLIKHIR